MNWLEHEYLVPVVMDNNVRSLDIAKRIKRITGLKVNIFAKEFTIYQRLFFKCHKVCPFDKSFLADYLISFADTLDSFEFPVIIAYKSELSALLGEYIERVECSYLIVDPTDISC